MIEASDLDVELLARLAHEQYVEQTRLLGGPVNERSLVLWNELSETLRESNRAQVGHIPTKLAAIGCRVEAGAQDHPFVFTDDEIETLARMEHDRWWLDRVVDGWTLGPSSDDVLRVSPWLVPWTELRGDIQDRDRAAVRAIPQLLAAAGMHVVRAADAATPSPELVELLKRVVPEFASRRHRFDELGRRIVDAIRELCASVAPTAIVTTRSKTVAGFAEKIVRKFPKYQDPLTEITDLCGVRVIVRTRSEVDGVGECIERGFDVDAENSVSHTQRLRPSEFGYRSVHFVVRLRAEELDADAADLGGLAAEVQVRTIAEHAWADVEHELSYKGAFTLPDRWTRELALIAAYAETIDDAFTDIQDGVRVYANSYGAYLDDHELSTELARVRALVATLPDDARLALRLARLLCASGDAAGAERQLADYRDRNQGPADRTTLMHVDAEILRELGELRCRRGIANGDQNVLQDGQAMLEGAARALSHANDRADAFARLGDTCESGPEQQRWYDEAFANDPADPRALTRFIESRTGLSLVDSTAMLRPAIDEARARCRAQLDVGHNTPRAFFALGELTMLVGETSIALALYAKAICASNHADVVEDALHAVGRLRGQPSCPAPFGVVQQMLELALVARFRAPAHAAQLVGAATRIDGTVARITPPAVIVVGATDRETATGAALLLQAFKDFSGTVLSGGTVQGISGAVGAIGAHDDNRARISTLGYLPARLPGDGSAERDGRYSEVRTSGGDGFGPAEPLQMWVDLVASGIRPEDVTVLAVGGGDLTAFELALALALGAKVGVIVGSGGAADALLADADWTDLASGRRIGLPNDSETVRAFVGSGASALDEASRECIARMVHDAYVERVAARQRSSNPSTRPFDQLPEALRTSNLRQADHIAAKLREIGCRTVPEPGTRAFAFEPHEIERLAEMEHGRWCAEKLSDGYRHGERRDDEAKTHPDLVPWRTLSDASQELCRNAVREIPEQLEAIGLAIERIDVSRKR